MPTHITSFFSNDELKTATLAPPFNFTKGLPVLKISGNAKSPMYRKMGMNFFQDTDNVLFDTRIDPEQLQPINNEKIELELINQMVELMEANDAPLEAFTRLGLEPKN